MTDANASSPSFMTPGDLVSHPAQSDWGVGQVQSVVGTRVTVNFEHVGKQTINSAVIRLKIVTPERF